MISYTAYNFWYHGRQVSSFVLSDSMRRELVIYSGYRSHRRTAESNSCRSMQERGILTRTNTIPERCI